jgi:hypothetical protein
MATPIASLGQHANVAEGVRAKLLPEYDGKKALPHSDL